MSQEGILDAEARDHCDRGAKNVGKKGFKDHPT